MPVYALDRELSFPPPEGASEEGIVAIGGDFSPERLLLAYSQGIFPWPTRGYPLLWFSPDPRFVLPPAEVRISRSLRRRIRRGEYEIRFDTDFEAVIRACGAVPRPGQDGTWITRELVEGYLRLHRLGYAHSIEAYRDDELVGGLYGISLGRFFFGESMFANAPDASKVAFISLLGNLFAWEFDLVDCQVHTDHLERFGAREIPRAAFLDRLRRSLTEDTRLGPWTPELAPEQALTRLLTRSRCTG